MCNDFWSRSTDRAVLDVFACESREQAEAVVRYASQPLLQMSDLGIVKKAPTPGPDRVLVIRSPARVRSWAHDAPPA
jgi:hypothetical protein